MAVAAEGASMCLQCVGGICQCMASVVESAKKAFRVFTKVVTCGQGWYGLFLNFLSLFNSVEDPDMQEFQLPVTEDRGMTDMAFLAIFVTVLVGMMVAMNRAIAYGRPEIYFQGIDSWGNVCGYDNFPIEGSVSSGMDMTNYNKLFIFDFISAASVLSSGDVAAMAEISSKTTMCVKNCPEITKSFSCEEYLGTKTQYPDAITDILCDSVDSELSILRERTVSFSVRNARCVPDVIHTSVSVTTQNEMLNLYSDDWVYNIIADCETCAAELTWITLIATVFTLIFIGVVQSSADHICWFSFSTFTIIGIISTSSMWYMYYDISSKDTPVLYFDDSPEEELLPNNGNTTANLTGRANFLPQSAEAVVPQAGYSMTFRDASILVTFIAGFFIIVIFFVGQRNMDFAAVLFKTGVVAMRKIRWIYILPLLTISAISFAAGLFLYTINRLTAVFLSDIRIVNDPTYDFPTVIMDKDTLYTSWVLLFEVLAAVWLLSFITSCQSLIACSAISDWYFSKDRRNLYRPMRIGSTRLIRCHLGSAALGGLLVGFLGWMRAPFSFLQSRLNKALINTNSPPSARSPEAVYSRTVELSEIASARSVATGDESVYSHSSSADVPATSKGLTDQNSRKGDNSRRKSHQKQKEIPVATSTHYGKLGSSSQKSLKKNRSCASLKNGAPPQTNSKSRINSDRTRPYGKTKDQRNTKTKINRTAILQCSAQIFSPCFWILNNALVYISDFNFGLVSLKGSSFLRSGYKLRETLLKDPKLKSLGATCSFALFLGKLSVVMIVLPFGFLLLKDKEGVFIYGYPLATSAVISYLVAHVFLSLLNAVAGTVFVCLMEDRALNDGTAYKPFFGTPELMQKSREILADGPQAGHKALRFASESRNRSSSRRVDGTSEYSKSSSSGSTVVSKQPRSKRISSGFGEDHSSLFRLMPQKGTKSKNAPVYDTLSYEYEEGYSRQKNDKRFLKKKGKNEKKYRVSQQERPNRNASSDESEYNRGEDHRKRCRVDQSSTSSGSTGLLGNLFNEDMDSVGNVHDRFNDGHEMDEDGMMGGHENESMDSSNDKETRERRKGRGKSKTDRQSKKKEKEKLAKRSKDSKKRKRDNTETKGKTDKKKTDPKNTTKSEEKKDKMNNAKRHKAAGSKNDSRGSGKGKEIANKSSKADLKDNKNKSKEPPSSQKEAKAEPHLKNPKSKVDKKEKQTKGKQKDTGVGKDHSTNHDKLEANKKHKQIEKPEKQNKPKETSKEKESRKRKSSISKREGASKTKDEAGRSRERKKTEAKKSEVKKDKSQKRTKNDVKSDKKDSSTSKKVKKQKKSNKPKSNNSEKTTKPVKTEKGGKKLGNLDGTKKPKDGKLKGLKKMKKPKLKGLKKLKPEKLKGLKKLKPNKLKGLKKPKMPKMKGLKKPKMPKMKGLKKPKMPKMKGLKKPKIGKLKGLKRPKMGKMNGFKRPKRGRLKMGGNKPGKLPANPSAGGNRMGGASHRPIGGRVGGGRRMKAGKAAKLTKGIGMAGTVIDGAQGAANIADGMLRVTGKKEDFNHEVERVAFGTRKRAKATTAVQHVMGGNTNISQAMKEVDEQFDEAERNQERMKIYEKEKRKAEKDHIKTLLENRNALRKSKKEAMNSRKK